ncbi:NADH dehydrogenase [ubiquinone] iron-sulfur protein 7, mitochondrial [Liparis tanakae]|uniref:NADH dehydrogenase [ubiquinone] iron-sulfur protein 7, mitochondrial n=1 Tax=Liparis tanakae TaxID=230148 RepID=A0A4Z2EGM8_9TELE|nr:NADH dehydrogenase [ubiquinone] iron-sulfur protein 7, mitochondrial [Liparis tanakae]
MSLWGSRREESNRTSHAQEASKSLHSRAPSENTCTSLVPVRQQSSAVAAAKPAAVATSKGEYVITKLDDLINWARRVRRGGRVWS